VNNSPLRDLMVMGQSGNSLAHYVKEHSRAKSVIFLPKKKKSSLTLAFRSCRNTLI